ncbi:D-alanine--D-alanine ligase [Spirochaetia bacterium]|nr:D-alanine--D-alanine ligase [Spirochaetia bacterium]
MQTKINVGILFGGKSAEHEVSLQSAKNVFDAIDREKYNPVLIGIDKTGRWLLENPSGGEFLLDSNDPQKIRLNHTEAQAAALPPQSGGLIARLDAPAGGGMGSSAGSGAVGTANDNGVQAALPRIDVVFPILHGPFGEDGTVQGLLKLADIPFVGTSVLGSAVGMDKDVMKRLLRDAGLPIGKFIALKSNEPFPPFDTVTAQLGSPLFIKPANMGSSVGVSKVHNQGEYEAAVRDAFRYDRKIILEEFIQGRELECAVLGNVDPRASVPGEVISSHEFYSYDAKYIDENGAVLSIPAKIPDTVREEIQRLAVKTFQVLEAEGLSRIDFFLRSDNSLVINEINTMPGFTKISMYPKLWEASGISYSDLINRLIELAVERFTIEKTLATSI